MVGDVLWCVLAFIVLCGMLLEAKFFAVFNNFISTFFGRIL